MSISVILNCYKRPHSLPLQIEALKNQSISIEEILIWKNPAIEIDKFDKNIFSECKFADSNYNFGVWSRFAYALNSKSDLICFFDDDTIPGPKWLENCTNEYNKQRGAYGTIGVNFFDLDYSRYERFGWANPNEKTVQVDIIGHSWFLDREMLSVFWRDAENPKSLYCGEDMNLSYSIQKYLKLNTYVPPHPQNDKSFWGSDPNLAIWLGSGEEAVSVQYHQQLFGESLRHYFNKGFKLQFIS